MSDHSRRRVLKGIGVGTAALVGGAGVASAGPPRDGPTIVDIASGVDRFSILVSALQRVGLDAALDGNRQLSVFAPNNGAFLDFLDESDDFDSLDDIPDSVLTAVLTYHVMPGRRDAASVTSSDEVPTLNGALVAVDGITLNGGQADIVGPDLAFASNGIIHEIDGVLLP